MKLYLAILLLSIQVSVVFAQEAKGIEKLLTTKEIQFKEVTIKKAIEQILDQVDIPFTIIVPLNDSGIKKSFEETKITMRLSAGVAYEEVVRQVFWCGGFSVKREGIAWIVQSFDRAALEGDDDEIRTVTHRLTKEEYQALGMSDGDGNFDLAALHKWLNNKSGEVGGYSVKRNTITIRTGKRKRDVLANLLSLHREGYKVPSLYSNMKKDEKTRP